jgi:hypothetical protein
LTSFNKKLYIYCFVFLPKPFTDMPFIIKSSQAKQFSLLDWEEIDIKKIYDYRRDFKTRHTKLKKRGLDFTNETKHVLVDTEVFNTLIQSAATGHYLVVQYLCQAKDRGFKDLTIALCIRRKRTVEPDDIPESLVFWADGREVTQSDLKKGAESYIGRKKKIKDEIGIPDYESDTKGRAHLITQTMKKVVQKMHDDNEVTGANGLKYYKHFYAYFILDSKLGSKALSVAFAVSEITTELRTLVKSDWVRDPPVAYDHGTACCPIG